MDFGHILLRGKSLFLGGPAKWALCRIEAVQRDFLAYIGITETLLVATQLCSTVKVTLPSAAGCASDNSASSAIVSASSAAAGTSGSASSAAAGASTQAASDMSASGSSATGSSMSMRSLGLLNVSRSHRLTFHCSVLNDRFIKPYFFDYCSKYRRRGAEPGFENGCSGRRCCCGCSALSSTALELSFGELGLIHIHYFSHVRFNQQLVPIGEFRGINLDKSLMLIFLGERCSIFTSLHSKTVVRMTLKPGLPSMKKRLEIIMRGIGNPMHILQSKV